MRRTSRRRTSYAPAWRPGWVLPNPVRAFHLMSGLGGDRGSTDALLKSAGLERESKRLRALHARTAVAYEAGRLAEGDRLAASADVLGEKIDTVLMALEEEYEGQQEPPIQSITRSMAETWNECMNPAWPSECRHHVEEYRRTGHGEWTEEQTRFVGPKSAALTIFSQAGDPVLPEQKPRYSGEVHGSGGMIIRSAWNRALSEHPEWFEVKAGYYEEPGLIYQLRELVGDREANGLLLLDAAEDAWFSTYATAARIRAGVKRRRSSGIDPVREAKKFVRRMTRRKKRTTRNRTRNRRTG